MIFSCAKSFDRNIWKNVYRKRKKFLEYLNNLLLISEKAMAPHSSTLAWKSPWMEEPRRLQSMGSLGVGHN